MNVIFILFVLAGLTWTCESKSIDLSTILKDVPENERSQFLKSHIKIGHDLSESRDSGAGLSEPEAFSLNVYNFVKSGYEIQDERQLEVLSNIICFDDGICIDIGDIGVHPKV